MTFPDLLRQPSAYLPVLLSLAALALIAAVATTVGVDRTPHDERLPARIFQLMLLLQLPLIATFAVKWLPSGRGSALAVLALQMTLAAAAIATVVWLEH